MNKLLNSVFGLLSLVLIAVTMSCGGDTKEEEDTSCTFAVDEQCFCLANPSDTQCAEVCTTAKTFEEDADCFCTNNPDDSKCEELKFQTDPITYCFENPESSFCVSILVGGGFETEQDTLGGLAAGEAGNAGTGQWFFAGNGSRATYTLVEATGVGGSGTKTLKIELLTTQANNWEQQIVNSKTEITLGKRYILLVDVKPDKAGRKVNLHGGTNGSLDDYNWWDYSGSKQFELAAGWNQLGIYIQAPLDPDPDNYPDYDELKVDHVRAQVDFAFAENNTEGDRGTFYVDNLRVIEVGDWLSFDDEPGLYCLYYGGDQCSE